MADFKKNKNEQQSMNNKPKGFQEPHGTPMAPERENQRKDMSNGGRNEQSKQNIGNKPFGQERNQNGMQQKKETSNDAQKGYKNQNDKCSGGTCKTDCNKCNDTECRNNKNCK